MSPYGAREGQPDATEPETSRETSPEAARRPSGWHPVNVGHLVMGLAFVGLAVVWLMVDREAVEVEDHGWVLGLPWLVAGAVGLAASAISGARRGR